MKNSCEVADVFRLYSKDYQRQTLLSYKKLKVMNHITVCRTAQLDGHIEQCDQCGFERNAYNSCRDRHCPKCQTMVKEKWFNDRKADLLPCNYFHLVFTVPHKLNPIILCNQKIMLNNLFAAVNLTFRHSQKIRSGKLKGNLDLYVSCIPGHRNLRTISIFIALLLVEPFHLIKNDGWLPKKHFCSGFNLWQRSLKNDILGFLKRRI